MHFRFAVYRMPVHSETFHRTISKPPYAQHFTGTYWCRHRWKSTTTSNKFDAVAPWSSECKRFNRIGSVGRRTEGAVRGTSTTWPADTHREGTPRWLNAISICWQLYYAFLQSDRIARGECASRRRMLPYAMNLSISWIIGPEMCYLWIGYGLIGIAFERWACVVLLLFLYVCPLLNNMRMCVCADMYRAVTKLLQTIFEQRRFHVFTAMHFLKIASFLCHI